MQKKILSILASALASASLLTALVLLLSGGYAEAAPTVTDTIIVKLADGVELSAGYTQTAKPGTVVTYTHVITNKGGFPDTFDLTHRSSQDWIVTHTSSIALGSDQAMPLVVSVTVPAHATGGLIDVTTITATSQLDSNNWDTATDTTIVGSYIHLPLVMHDYTLNWNQGGLVGRMVYQIAVCAADPKRLYAGTGEGVFRSIDGGASWQPTGLQRILVRGLDVAADDCDQVYAATWGQHVQHSANGGDSWSALSAGLPEPYLYTVVVDASSNALYAGTASNGVYQLPDGGTGWESIFNQPNSGTITRLTLAASPFPTTPNPLLVATWGGNAWLLMGPPWTATLLNVPENNVFEIVRGNGNVSFAATENRLYRNTGAGWEEVHGERAYYGVAVDPDQAQVVYAATSDGAWRSTDGGEQFSRFGLDGLIVRHIAPGPQGSALLHAGTADGAWRRTRPVSTVQSR